MTEMNDERADALDALGVWLLDAAQRRIGLRIIAEAEALLDGDEQRAQEIREGLNRLDVDMLAQAEHSLIGALVFSADDPRELLTRAELNLIDRLDPPIDVDDA